MSSKKKICLALFIVFIIGLNVFIIRTVNTDFIGGLYNIELHILLSADSVDDFQLYYSETEDSFSPAQMKTIHYVPEDKPWKLIYPFSTDMRYFRFDPGELSHKVEIDEISITYRKKTKILDLSDPSIKDRLVNVDDAVYEKGKLKLSISSEDPQFLDPVNAADIEELLDGIYHDPRRDFIFDVILCVVIDLISILFILHFDGITMIPMEIFHNRKLVATLSKNDFKGKFAGSYLGIVWAFIQPVVTILVYWFVFQIGFRSGNVSGYPFVLYLTVGITTWFFFADALNGGTGAMTEYSYLVKKVVFNINILPFVKVVSALFVHLFFIAFSIVLLACYGFLPDLYDLQIIYYVLCTFVFVLGLTYFTSAITVFFRDMAQIINIVVLQVGIWLTPIMWDAENTLSPKLLLLFKLNPMFYIVDGFRDALLYKSWVWEGKGLWTLYFWTVTLLAFSVGVIVFRKLKIHFADIL